MIARISATMVFGLLAIAGSAEAAGKARTRNVAIVLYDGVELLDFAGPGEVFAAHGHAGAIADEPAFRVYTVGRTKSPLTSEGFVKIVPAFSIEDAPKPDVVLSPGGGLRSI